MVNNPLSLYRTKLQKLGIAFRLGNINEYVFVFEYRFYCGIYTHWFDLRSIQFSSVHHDGVDGITSTGGLTWGGDHIEEVLIKTEKVTIFLLSCCHWTVLWTYCGCKLLRSLNELKQLYKKWCRDPDGRFLTIVCATTKTLYEFV